MKSIIENMHIGTRIILGFCLVLLCVCIVGVFSIYSLGVSNQNLRSLSESTTGAIDAINLERDVVDLQRNVQAFSFTGQNSIAVSVRSLIDKIRKDLDVLKYRSSIQEIELVDRMHNHLNTYEQTFDLAEEERQIRRTLVGTGVVELRNRIEKYLSSVSKKDQSSFQNLKNRFLDVERNLHRYLYDPNYDSVVNSLRNLDRAVESLPGLSVDAKASLLDYRKTVLRIVRATRGYLYLTGVVMAGEASEFSYASQQLKKMMLEESDQIAVSLKASNQKLKDVTLTVCCFSVLSGIGLSFLIGRSISHPIRSISNTFERIVDGDNSARIPGQHRKDEIGILARAANVLKKQKRQTETLLDYSETITKQLKYRTEDLERSNQELDQFIYTISHDLKTPIVSAQGFLGLMRQKIEKGEIQDAIGKLGRIENATNRMSELISDILNLNRIGRVDIEMELINVNDLILDLLGCLDHLIRKRRIRLTVQSELPMVYGNPSRVRQVFENLIGNAIKYVGDQPAPEISITAKESGNQLHFCVADNGPGIAPEFHEKIFALFQRVNNSTEGTGIGLSIVRKIMTIHSGNVWIDSEGTNDGCRFWLQFPVISPEPDSELVNGNSMNSRMAGTGRQLACSV